MVAFRLLAGIIFAAIFCTMFVGMYGTYREENAKLVSRREAEELAKRIKTLADQDSGTRTFFTITVPSNCELRFENRALVVIIDKNVGTHDVGVQVTGPSISGRQAKLTLERTGEGVIVSGGR